MNKKNKVFITATSSNSCAGNNDATLFHHICEGKSGILQDTNYFHNATPAIGKLFSTTTFDETLIAQCENILNQSHLENFNETLLIVGSSVGGMCRSEEIYFETQSYKNIDPNFHHINAIKNILNAKFEFYDHISFSTACTSSANALGYAYEVLSKGLYKNALVIGADSLSQITVGGFLSLGVLSSSPCKPFDTHRNGMNVAEAIACLLLENEVRSTAVELCGVGYSSDAYHMTHPHPDGEGAMLAMSRALKSAGIEAKEIDYINAHGTGTIANDRAEAHAIAQLFPSQPYVSSSKSITGHTLGAAGALEAIVACMVVKEQQVPQNSFLEVPENSRLNLTLETQNVWINYVLSNSFAFGGNNCSLVFGKLS
ncbi:MAG: 3-oxoacyl-[acyl-carrier-protein] synthase, KASII (EC [uncultured Sulfurovum sp.]|uniref:3-oxoacyl-[acyl-carrier-protein] synthase, KASII (EC) n=1 Tax=uncultured Sulfurovum sp. TaxID=269237 RepID=A0A6S6TGM1_9BACT|nr:MAG: 3-oxoacyl-[acyl-carrier-protein] synthase, KASII (EC [uncultured Sulfurovum sp.]